MSLLAAVDLNWLLQFIVTVFIVAFGLIHLIKNTASKYFLADENDNDGLSDWSPPAAALKNSGKHMMKTATGTRELTAEEDACAVCGNLTKKKCSGCKMVMYCSEVCQRSHWRLEHKTKCRDFQLSGKSTLGGKKACSVTSGGSSKIIRSKEMLFPYEEFVNFFNWDRSGFPPCGLLNCGNSCFANVVLQCLAYTKPLIAFLLERGHRKECRRNDWCFFCEFQTHIERVSRSSQPFSPINILSRLPNIGGTLGYGKQEDAHEFMRFAIDTMQSVCLDEFGGEKGVHPCSQETTLIQHIFGGHLQSQVICTKCKKVSNQFENMMDLTVEIHGNAASLEECLNQFTVREQLHGDNMYKCDGCNDYVMAWKRLTVRRGPNILTIALKRFQSGRFGKLNKRVSFPETLDLSPYMSETGEDNNVYKLYAVIVHVDMLNASFFGHYICYIKDFQGNWYRIDDCKVSLVDLEEVLSQGAYMLLYSRICARPSSLYPIDPSRKDEQESSRVGKEDQTSSTTLDECHSTKSSNDTLVGSGSLPSDNISETKVNSSSEEISVQNKSEVVKEGFEREDLKKSFPIPMDIEICEGVQVPADDADPAKHSHGCEGNNNLPSMDASETVILKVEHPSSSNFEVGDETRASAQIASQYSIDNVRTQNHVNEKERIQVDDFAAVSSSNLDFDVPKAASCVEKTKKAGCRDTPFSNILQDAAGKLEGRCSHTNLKPLFSPGFLDRRLQNKSSMGESKVPVELEKVYNGNSNCCTNGVTSPCNSCDSGSIEKLG